MRFYFMLSLALFAVASFADARTDFELLSGTHHSACTPIALNGRKAFTRLILTFNGHKYRSSEVIYSDRECEISVLQTTSQGTWTIGRGAVLNLSLARMQMRPLDPRMADSLASTRACGKTWENGVSNEILNTSCAKGRKADYFIAENTSRKSLKLDECEGRRTAGSGCTHYKMTKSPEPPFTKVLKIQDSRRVSRK